VGGSLVVASLLAMLWMTGLLADHLQGPVLAATLVASLSCSLGMVFKAFALTGSGLGTNHGQLLQIAILGDFLLQLLMLSGILLGMYLLSTKLSSMTSFALTYAAVVMVFPLVATVILGKELKRQARSSEPTLDQQVGDVSSR